MKFSVATILLALTAVTTTTTVVEAQPEPGYQVDTSNRAPAFFDQPKARKGGYTYMDEFHVSVNGEMDSSIMKLKGSLEATADASTVVENTSSGGKKLELTMLNVKADVKSMVMTMHCDSNDRKKSAPDCEELFVIVGESETIETDANGELVSLTTFDGQHIDMATMTEAANAMTMADQFKANQFAASTHFDKTSQMLKLIPDHAVRPGDSWIDDVEMGQLGTFKGNSYLQGYTNYEGSDCAVFYFEGSLHLDISSIAQAIGADPATLPSNMSDAKITNVIFWDTQDKISRWAEANVTTSFDIANPMDPTPGNLVHVPVTLSVSLATDITVRPDHDDEADRDDDSTTQSSSGLYIPNNSNSNSNSNSSKSGGSGGGFFKATFFIVIVGAAAGGGFLLYKKRKEDQQMMHGGDVNRGFVSPSYEFSAVGSEPMVVNSPMV